MAFFYLSSCYNSAHAQLNLDHAHQFFFRRFGIIVETNENLHSAKIDNNDLLMSVFFLGFVFGKYVTSLSSCNHDLINRLFIHCIIVCLLLLLFLSCMLQVALQILLNFIFWLTNLFLLCCVLVKKNLVCGQYFSFIIVTIIMTIRIL